MPSFSQRHNYAKPPAITVREELPEKLRAPIVDIAAQSAGSVKLLQIAESVLNPYGLVPPEPIHPIAALWSGDEKLLAARKKVNDCQWFQVYDLVEAIYRFLDQQDKQPGVPTRSSKYAPAFGRRINAYFVYAGIGWHLVNGEIVTRDDEAFEGTVKTAINVLQKAGRPTASERVKFAILALSSRPKPDTSGAVAHAASAVECVLGDVTGETLTLGKYLDRYPELFHPALKKGLDGLYGYASDVARHGKEGTEPTREDAAFVVAMCAAASTLLTRKHPKSAAA